MSRLPGAILSGFIVYLVLSNLFTPFRIVAPVSIIVSILIFGLTDYYYHSGERTNVQYESTRKENNPSKKKSISIPNLFFIVIYAISIIFVFLPHEVSQVFISWEQITIPNVLRLAAAIILCLFAPGYVLINTLCRRYELAFLPKFLLGYLFSVLVTGLTAYVISSIGMPFLYVHNTIIAINLVMLGIFIYTAVYENGTIKSIVYRPSNLLTNWEVVKKQNFSMLLVFASLFALVIVYTTYLYDGTIIGDQWFHHGRALMFLSDMYRDFGAAGISAPYPPLFSAFLAAFFNLSNIPSVNAYASINFLNFMPVIAFYYFFLKWIPFRKKAALLTIVLFMLGSGYGWVYLLYLTQTNHHNTILDPTSALEVLQSASIKTFDVWVPNTFIDVGHPDITSGLIIIALPAGFVLLGLMKEKLTNKKFIYFLIITGVTAVGYLFHAEFGLFILVGTVLTLIFRLDNKSYYIAAILAALGLVTIVDFLSPENYYRARTILFGFPFEMIVLYVLFIVSVWVLYLSRALNKIHIPNNLREILESKISKGQTRFVLGVIIVSLVFYLYILSFITWDTLLPSIDIRVQTNDLSVVPWYFYPMRLGIAGLLALSFILSYIFKRFEKEIFVLGIIAIIAFLIGPYYSELRFNKYIMASMAGLASLFIYEILTIRLVSKPVIGGLLIATIVISSGISVLVYASYIALGLENPNTSFNGMLPRRHFPSDSELLLIDFLRSHLNPRKDNIALPANELASSMLGSFATISAFGGIPESKLAQSPWVLQESNLEGFYTLLDYTNAQFIILPKKYIIEHKNDDNNRLSYVLRFALDNFKRVYEDDKYLVLSVPPFAPPTNGGEIAFVSPPSLDYYYHIPPINSSKTLDYNKDFVISNNRSQLLQMGRVVTLKGNETIMSNTIQDNINYIEARFKVIGGNNTDNHGGIVWKDGDKSYYAFIRPDRRLSLATPIGNELISESLARGKGKWFTLKVVDINGTFKIFLDDVLQISAIQSSANASISQVGIRSYNSGAQFEPITIGKTATSYEEAKTSDPRYKYYYSLSALALSKIKYSVFADGDFSAFSKRNIILPYDPLHPGPYLEFLEKGGNVIVLNADKYLGGGFSKLLCLKPDNNEKQFDGIRGSKGEVIEASGITMNIKKYCADAIIKSSYIKNGQVIAPFIVEKDYGNGKIIFANTYGYFSAVSKQPHEYFLKIGSIIPLINIKGDQFTKKITPVNAIPSSRFVGNLSMSGQVEINSSSLVLLDNDLYAEQILMKPGQKENKSSPLLYFNNTRIRDLKIYGTYSVLVNTTGLSYVPSTPSSLSLPPYNYINLDLPSPSNITVRIFNNGSRVEFFLGELPIKVTQGEIEFKGVSERSNNNDSVIAVPPAVTSTTNSSYGLKITTNNDGDNYVPVLMKNPEIELLNGTLSFDELHSNNPYTPTKPWASEVPIQVKGKTILKLDHMNTDVDNKTKHVTYFTWVEVHADANRPLVKSTGFLLEVPWHVIINSHINVIVALVISGIAALTIYVGWSKPRPKKLIK